ncbi:MAG: hypothetical protein V3W18_05585 [candidate division Zixibacteria bacterium]
MKAVLLLMLIIGQQNESFVSGTELVFRGGLLPPDKLANENKEYEDEALSLLDSLRTTNTAFSLFDSKLAAKDYKPNPFTPIIDERNNFDGFPCLHFYLVSTGIIEYGTDYNTNYEYLFYNSCNSSIYCLGSGLEPFNNVFQPLITAVADSSSLKKLVMLYLNTITFSSIYFEVDSFDDIITHYPDTLLWSSEEFNYDRTLIKNLLKNKQNLDTNDRQEIQMYTWNLATGNFDYWHFRMIDDSLLLEYSLTLINGFGPYQRWRD